MIGCNHSDNQKEYYQHKIIYECLMSLVVSERHANGRCSVVGWPVKEFHV
jgi:hypothetical protein